MNILTERERILMHSNRNRNRVLRYLCVRSIWQARFRFGKYFYVYQKLLAERMSNN